MLAVVVSIPAEWLAIAVALVAVVVYVVTSKVLVDKSVKNIEEIWPELGKITKLTTDNSDRISDLEGAHRAKGCFVPRPPAK